MYTSCVLWGTLLAFPFMNFSCFTLQKIKNKRIKEEVDLNETFYFHPSGTKFFIQPSPCLTSTRFVQSVQ